jgi:hypothetical protein
MGLLPKMTKLDLKMGAILNELLSPPPEKKRRRRVGSGADVREALVNLDPDVKEAMLKEVYIAQDCFDTLAADLQSLDSGPAQDKLTRLLLTASKATTRFRNAVLTKENLEAKKAEKA